MTLRTLTPRALCFLLLATGMTDAAPKFKERNTSFPTPVSFKSARRGRIVAALYPDKNLRALARATVPKSASSEFFGAARGQFPNGSGVLVTHFYSVPTGQKSRALGSSEPGFRLFLDLFRANKGATLRRLNHLDLTGLPSLYSNWARGSDGISTVVITWADARAQRVPIVRAQMFGTAISGAPGTEVLIAFPNGLNRPPTMRDFETSESFSNSRRVFFRRDKRGFLVVRVEETLIHMDFDRQQTTSSLANRTEFAWNGRTFAPLAKR